MDRKSLIVLALCFAVLLGMQPVVNHFFPPIPVPASTNVVSRVTYPTNHVATGTNQPLAEAPATTGTPTPANPARFVVNTNLAEQILVVTNQEARYQFTSRGGGLLDVELLRYPESVGTRREKLLQTNDFATLNSASQPPVLALLGAESLQDDGVFTLTPTAGGMRAEKLLANGLRIVKEYQLGSNYLVSASVKLVNPLTNAVIVPAHQLIVGTATPMNPQDNGMAVTVLWYNGIKTEQVGLSYFNTNTTSFIFFPRTPQSEYKGGNTNVVWVAVQNQYFTLVAMPTNPAPALSVRMVDLPPPSAEELRTKAQTVAAPKGLLTAIDYPAQMLAPGGSIEHDFNLFAGPKEYRLLAKTGDRFNNNVDLVMTFNGFFGTFAKLLLLGMNWFHAVLNMPYGWAIVTITVLLKLVFWPLTQYSTRSAKRMAALQPQMKALQAKYKDDPAKLSQKQMAFWKENKVNPLSGCLPMVLQMPVLLGFYRMLQSAIELRGAPWLWVNDLSKSDTIYTIFFPVALPIIGSRFPINPLPLLMGVTMLWQGRITPPAPGMDPAQQKMMRYMPLIMLVVLYNFSSGLALYWTVQNLLTVLQTKLTTTQPAAATAKPLVPIAPQKKK